VGDAWIVGASDAFWARLNLDRRVAMTITVRALGVAASLLMGTALAASAATTADNQGNTAPTTSSAQPGTQTAPSYRGSTGSTTTVSPGYQTSESSVNGKPATAKPQVDRGNAEGAAGGSGH
jgi:hypothetical protein